jgi:hypothetical protein
LKPVIQCRIDGSCYILDVVGGSCRIRVEGRHGSHRLDVFLGHDIVSLCSGKIILARWRKMQLGLGSS